MENLNFALLLTFVGMLTVFAALALLVLLGKYLIVFVNRFVPEDVPEKPVAAGVRGAIDEAVRVLTSGRGRVSRVEKL